MPDVLVVADNADLRYLLEITLTLEGQAVETAVGLHPVRYNPRIGQESRL